MPRRDEPLVDETKAYIKGRADIIMLSIDDKFVTDQEVAFAVAQLYAAAERHYGKSLMAEQKVAADREHQWYLEGLCVKCGKYLGETVEEDTLICNDCLNNIRRKEGMHRLVEMRPVGGTC